MERIGLDVKSLEKELNYLKALLDDAIICLKNVTRNDITELKTFTTPPEVVQKVIISVALIMGEKGDFATGRTVIQDLGLISKLSGVDPREIPLENVEALNHIVHSPDYDPDNVAESASSAKYLCLWSLAIHKYLSYYHKIKPKIDALESVRKNYERMKHEIQILEEELVEKRKDLTELDERRSSCEREQRDLEEQRESTRKKIKSVHSLVEYLKPHFSNWEEGHKKLDDRLLVVTGNSLLAGACIEYFGILDKTNRRKLLLGWQKILSGLGIKSSPNFLLHEFLVKKQEVYSWSLSGLPASTINLENATIMKYNQKAKVIFDPNDTCLTWMKQQQGVSEAKEILISSVADPHLSSKLQQALERGLNLIIDFFNGDLDGVLSYLLTPTLAVVEGQKTIRIEDMWYNYDENFDFFLITRDKRVLSRREVQVKCCLLKFSLDADGMSKSIRSLLSKIFDEERQTRLIEQEQLLLEKKQLVNTNQESILRRLIVSTDDAILEDSEYIELLKQHQTMSAKVEKEASEEASRLQLNMAERTPIDPLVTGLMDMFCTMERFSLQEPYLQFSMNHFLNITSRIVGQLHLRSMDDFNKEACLDVIARVYNVMTAGATPETKLFVLIDICVSITKTYNQFRSDVWNYIISPKKASTGTDGEDMNLEPSIWQSLKNLQSMIPGLEMEHLPVLVSSFNKISELGVRGAVKQATATMGHLTSLEKLALCISFLPDNFNLCLEIFAEDVLPGTIRKAIPVEKVLQMCHYDQPLIYMQPNSFDFMDLGEKIWRDLQTVSQVVYCGNSNWEQIKSRLDEALTAGTVIILSEFNLFPDIHEQTSRYMREVENNKKAKNPKFRLIISTKPSDDRMSVELISMSVKVLDLGDDLSHTSYPAGALLPYLNLADVESLKGASVRLQNMVLHSLFSCFVVATRAKYGFFESPLLSETEVKIVASLLNSLAKTKVNIEGAESDEVEVFVNRFVWNSLSNHMDTLVVSWYMGNGFLSDSRPGLYFKSVDIMKDWFSRGELSIKDVIEDIKMLQVDADRTSGLNPDNIDHFHKQTAKFFSNNIINLERKDYSALVANQSRQELKFTRRIHYMLEDNDYRQVVNWNPLKRILLPDEKTLSEICRYSYVKRYLVKEIAALNDLLDLVQEDTHTMKMVDYGTFTADSRHEQVKSGLLQGKVPLHWMQMSRVFGLHFRSWRDLIKQRHHNLAKQAALLEQESKVFNLRWFANPKGLLDSIVLDAAYRRAPSTRFDDIVMTFKATNIFERSIDQLTDGEYYVVGLKVSNAYQGCLGVYKYHCL